MKTPKLLGCGMMSALFALSPTAQAIEGELKKPQTMEEMWKIIQTQQQQINEMQKKLEQANAAPAGNQVQTLERKTNVLTEEALVMLA